MKKQLRTGSLRPEKRVMLLRGDAQAEAVALVLRAIPAVTQSYEVLYSDARQDADAPASADFADCAFFFEQYGAGVPNAVRLPRTCRKITFPALSFRLLWPLSAPNPYNPADAANSHGPFPWGDSFVIECVRHGVPAEKILRNYETPAWHPSWPSLDALFMEQSVALPAADAKCDVRIGSFILKHFRKTRLFWTMNAPSNHLIAELVYRILHAAFGAQAGMGRDDVRAAIEPIGDLDILAGVTVPVHPLVAQHFRLEWYDPLETYASVGGERRTFVEYYRDMIAAAAGFN